MRRGLGVDFCPVLFLEMDGGYSIIFCIEGSRDKRNWQSAIFMAKRRFNSIGGYAWKGARGTNMQIEFLIRV